MKFRLVESFINESDLTSPTLINELKQQFGNDFDYKPLCKEITEYISTKFSVKGLFYNILVLSREDGIISNNGHCVIYHNNKIYDYTSNQYASYPGIESSNCPRILEFNEELTNMFGLKSYSNKNYIICVGE